MSDRNPSSLMDSPAHLEQAPRGEAEGPLDLCNVLKCVELAATLLFINGQTTRQTLAAAAQLAAALGAEAVVLPRWGELAIRVKRAGHVQRVIVAANPTSVDMAKVAATMRLIDALSGGRYRAGAVLTDLQAIREARPVSMLRFAVMAGAGASALAVIFGAIGSAEVALTGLTAFAGGLIRRWLAGIGRNPFVQPLAAALLAGLVGALLVRSSLTGRQLWVAICSCMVLVPGPHVLNGAIDLVRGRIALGAARTAFAGLVTLAVCTGLLLGLGLGGQSLAVDAPSVPVPLLYDVLAAGIAVMAYGTFFSMPWRMLPFPILIGMLAHGLHWALLSLAHTSVEAGALAACLFVGTVVTLLGDRLRLPFAAFAFASVVSLIPGVYLFRMAAGLTRLAALGADAPPALLLATISDGATAFLVTYAITLGLIVPRMTIPYVLDARRG